MKRALLVGINYINTPNQLNGCVNDVYCVKESLEKRGFHVETLTDSQATRQEILLGLMRLVTSDATTLFFHYSGHGASVPDDDGDEVDKIDECLCPVDGTLIRDDALRGVLCSLQPNQKLFCLLDCCHSGTGMDLKYTYDSQFNTISSNGKYTDTKGLCISLSGCTDTQTSSDAYIQGKYQGALTYAFHKIIEKHASSTLSYGILLSEVRKLLETEGYTQRPQMTCGKIVDPRSKLFL